MMHRVVVDIGDEGSEVVFRADEFAVIVWDEQASFSFVEFVVSLSISIKKMRKLTTYGIAKPSKGLKPLEGWIRLFSSQKLQNLFLIFNPHHQMQMIRHQAVRIRLSYWLYMVAVFLKEISIVPVFSKQIFIAICMCPDMVHPGNFERYSFLGHCFVVLHGRAQPSKGFETLGGFFDMIPKARKPYSH